MALPLPLAPSTSAYTTIGSFTMIETESPTIVQDAPSMANTDSKSVISPPGIHTIPLTSRPPPSLLLTFAYLIPLTVLFIIMHSSQLILYPLSFIPGGLREAYWNYIDFTKESFVRVVIFLSGASGEGTELVVTLGEGVERDSVMKKVEGEWRLKFDKRAVWISNHQAYIDWIYTWILFYYSDLAGALTILLKKSLRLLPIGGPAMILWNFLFLSQNWEIDQGPIGIHLDTLGRRATKHDKSLAVLIYPEGTLVSALTRPKSAKYAEKINVPDLKNLLLPRSTGLFFCLRTLARRVPDLSLYDMTVAYPGVPAQGYAQSYYSLASCYPSNQPPPQVHIHIKRHSLSSIPLGPIIPLLPSSKTNQLSKEMTDSPEEEIKQKEIFDIWLRGEWKKKDELMDSFYEKGEFGEEGDRTVKIQIGLRGVDDWLAVGSTVVIPYISYIVLKHSYRYITLAVGLYLEGF